MAVRKKRGGHGLSVRALPKKMAVRKKIV